MTLGSRFAIAGMLLFAGLCHAQQPHQIAPEGYSPSDQLVWRDHLPVVELRDPLGEEPPSVWIDENSTAMPILEMEESGEAAACNCGTKHCHGVCRDPGHPKKPKHEQPGDVDRGDCPPLRYRMSDCRRAGNPHAVHRFAKCSVTDKYSAWFVGGGAPFFRGRCRESDEGTWGMDYSGLFGHANVWLNYTRGRNQGGEGAYRTDGEPKVVSRAHEILGLGH